jgi:hypothetical protein
MACRVKKRHSKEVDMKTLITIITVVGAVVWLATVVTLSLQGKVWEVAAMRVALLAPIFLAILFTLYRAKRIKRGRNE